MHPSVLTVILCKHCLNKRTCFQHGTSDRLKVSVSVGARSKTVQFTYMLGSVFNLLTNCWGSYPWHLLVLSSRNPTTPTAWEQTSGSRRQVHVLPRETIGRKSHLVNSTWAGGEGSASREAGLTGIWSKVEHTAWYEVSSISYWTNGLKKKEIRGLLKKR